MATIPNTGKKKAAIYSVKDRHYKQGGCYVKYSTQNNHWGSLVFLCW
jgi:hypothetical protein